MFIRQLYVGCSSVCKQCSVYHPLTWISTGCSSPSLINISRPDSQNSTGPCLSLGLGNPDTSRGARITNTSSPSPTWVLRLPWLFLGSHSLLSTLDSPTTSAGSSVYLLVCPVSRLGSRILDLFLSLLTFFRTGVKCIIRIPSATSGSSGISEIKNKQKSDPTSH